MEAFLEEFRRALFAVESLLSFVVMELDTGVQLCGYLKYVFSSSQVKNVVSVLLHVPGKIP
eukprot:9452463-Ditylum_brightwellii.AAC.1